MPIIADPISHVLHSATSTGLDKLVKVCWLDSNFFFLRIVRANNPDNLSLTARLVELDLLGAAVLMPAIIMLLLALQWGGAQYPVRAIAHHYYCAIIIDCWLTRDTLVERQADNWPLRRRRCHDYVLHRR